MRKRNPIILRMAASFIDEFRSYFRQEDIAGRTAELLRGVDEKSVLTAEVFIDRYRRFIAAYEALGDKFYVDEDDFITDEERSVKRLPEKYVGRLPEDRYEYNVFVKHCGLKLTPRHVKEYIRGKDFIDGGAFIGDSALVLSEYRPRKIYCFEPSRQSIELLKKTASMNGLNNVEAINMGLGGAESEAVMSLSGPGSSFLPKSKKKPQQEAHITTIDGFMEVRGGPVGLIKLDVEGMEYEAIQGARNTIIKDRPVLLISLYHSARDFFEIKPLLEEWLDDYNFIITKENNTMFYEIMLVAYPRV